MVAANAAGSTTSSFSQAVTAEALPEGVKPPQARVKDGETDRIYLKWEQPEKPNGMYHNIFYSTCYLGIVVLLICSNITSYFRLISSNNIYTAFCKMGNILLKFVVHRLLKNFKCLLVCDILLL